MRTHPYAEAVYEVIPLAAGGFGVKTSISDTSPATVNRFDTVAAAEAWRRRPRGPRPEPTSAEDYLAQAV